jgi:hypothetical protein
VNVFLYAIYLLCMCIGFVTIGYVGIQYGAEAAGLAILVLVVGMCAGAVVELMNRPVFVRRPRVEAPTPVPPEVAREIMLREKPTYETHLDDLVYRQKPRENEGGKP